MNIAFNVQKNCCMVRIFAKRYSIQTRLETGTSDAFFGGRLVASEYPIVAHVASQTLTSRVALGVCGCGTLGASGELTGWL